jgi:hypothetical protein
MPVINFGALQPVAANTGLSSFLESSLPPSSANGLGNPNPPQQQPAAPSFTKQFYDKPPTPALPQPPKVDYRGKAESFFGKDDINEYLRNLQSPNADRNAEFQRFIGKYIGETPVFENGVYDSNSYSGNNPKMIRLLDHHFNSIDTAARDMIANPYDKNRQYKLYGRLSKAADEIRPSPAASAAAPPEAEYKFDPNFVEPDLEGSEAVAPISIAPSAVAPSAAEPDSKSWYQFWKGGRKTARNRNRSRSRSGKKTRARKLKQRSRKRAVRRR